MNNLLIFCLFTLFFSCNKKSDLEQVFITKQNEYWKYKDDCQSYGVYFKFNEKGNYDKYNRDIYDGFELFNNDGDLISSKRTWSVKSDSVFSWDGEDYKIESRNNAEIILSYINEEKKDCRITLKKIVDK